MFCPELDSDTAPETGPFAALLTALPSPAYACAPDGRLLCYNEHAVALWGRRPALNDPADRYCGSHAMLTPDGAPLPHSAGWMALCLERGEAYSDKEIVVLRPDGHARTVLSYVTPLRDSAGRLIAATAVLVDITQRAKAQRATEAALRASEESLRAFFDSNVAGFVQVNAAGRFTRVNDRYCRLTGYSRAELLTMRPFDLDHPDDRATDIELVKNAIADPTGVYDTIKRYVRKDGSLGWVHVAANFFRDEAGRPTHSAGVALDVSAQKTAEQAARRADRTKDEFLATLAHELRNPLASLRNAVELLRRREQDGAWCRDVIERQVRQLARLMDDLLDVSRIAQGKLELRKETLEVADAIKPAVDASRPLFEGRGQQLQLTMEQERTYVEVDGARMTQVLTNLLTNASKFTGGGGTIRVAVDSEPDAVRIRVADTGIGIAPEELTRVFDKYYQVPRRGHGRPGGLGIGLSLVRRLVELHGGSVEARSEGRGRGSEFIVRLPIAAAAPRRVVALEPNVSAMNPLAGARSRPN